MTYRRFPSLLFAPLAALLLLAACADEADVEEPMDPETTEMTTPESTAPTIVEAALNDGRFSTLATALDSAGLVQTLQGPGPFTVFAPTDEAFAQIPQDQLNSLLQPANRAQLRDVLLYHVADGRVMAADVQGMQSVETLQGGMLPVRTQGGQVMIGDATVTAADVEASNGVIHVIDAVLMPGM